MTSDWQELEFDTATASPDLWRMYHAYRRARWVERGDPEEPYSPDDVFADSWRQERQEQDWSAF